MKTKSLRKKNNTKIGNIRAEWSLLLLLSAPLLGAEEAEGVSYVRGAAVCLNGQGTPVLAEHVDAPFPLMSVVKLPLAVAVLDKVDKGELDLEQGFDLTPADLDGETWSPLLKEHPQGGHFTLRGLLEYCIAKSDNNACDILFRLVGGPAVVESFFRNHYGENYDLNIVCGEEAFRESPEKMRENTASPRALAMLLNDLYAAAHQADNPLISNTSASLLLEIMVQTHTGADRLLAACPPNAKLAHKTGSSGTHNGVTLAFNDIGILMLPNGSYASVVCLIRDSKEDTATMSAAHAEVLRQTLKLLNSPE